MDTNIKNWLSYGEKIITGKDIRFDCVHLAILSFFYNLFYFSHITVRIMDIAALALFLALGLRAKGKATHLDAFLYKGITCMTISIRWYMFSWLFTVRSGGNAGIAFAFYVVLFVALSIWYGYIIKRNVSKNVFSGDYKGPAGWAGLCGAALAAMLCPIIFSNVTQDTANMIVAVCAVLVGAMMHCGIGALFKFAVMRKLNGVTAKQ